MENILEKSFTFLTLKTFISIQKLTTQLKNAQDSLNLHNSAADSTSGRKKLNGFISANQKLS